MIIFEVVSSPDIEKVGEFTYFYENFTLGSGRKSDLLFIDPEIEEVHLSFIHHKDGLLIKTVKECSYHSNGKKLRGGKLHKVGDEFKVGSTIIKIKHLEHKNLSESFKDLYENRLKENPDLEPVITQIQKEIIYLENNKDV